MKPIIRYQAYEQQSACFHCYHKKRHVQHIFRVVGVAIYLCDKCLSQLKREVAAIPEPEVKA